MSGNRGESASERDSDFEAIYSRMLASARASRDRHGAEDRVQEACVRLLEVSADGAVRNKEGYFRRILRNLMLDEKSRLGRQAALPLDEMIPDPAPASDKIAQARQELARVAQALDRLPPRCKSAFELHRFANLSYAQIAHRMGISISMVEKHVAEAVLRLASALDDERVR